MATITVNELAEKLESDPRTTRKFLRSVTPKEGQPGKGGRWAIEKKSVRSLTAQYAKWTAEQDAARAERDAAKVEEPTISEPVDDREDAGETLEEGPQETDDIVLETQPEDDEDDDLPMPKHDD